MADYIVIPPAREVRGTITAPPSKSATNRALVLAALSETPVEIETPLDSEDTRALIRCLTAMGAHIETSARGLRAHGPLGLSPAEEVTLDAAESGTAARFLTALAAAVPGSFLLTGSARLRERPMGELVTSLVSLGAAIEDRGAAGTLPLRIRGQTLRSGRVEVDASRSSQFLSALLLAGPAVPGGLEVSASSTIASSPYVATTGETLRAFGHEVSGELAGGGAIRVRRGRQAPERFAVPGDYSSALPLLAAAGMVGGEVTVTGLAWPSGDADAGAIPVLERMGLQIESRAESVTARHGRGRPLAPVEVSATDFPDAVPTLAALAALAPGESRFEGIAHLRLKESDRIESLAALLSDSGADARARDNCLVVKGPVARSAGPPRRLRPSNDHRIAMAAGLLSLAVTGLLIENPGCVAKSYPGFFAALDALATRT
jgi:3-phosphoshikimate 1-carboxyvinyltransferase